MLYKKQFYIFFFTNLIYIKQNKRGKVIINQNKNKNIKHIKHSI